jgi:riboflavin kinase/FMN adenylyltransferase
MENFWSLESVYLKDAWLTIGSFDGVHRGHQEIIKALAAGAHRAGAPAVVLTFYPHPAVVLRKRRSAGSSDTGIQDAFYLTSPEGRAALLGKLGVDVVVNHPFNLTIASLSAADFVKYLSAHLGLRKLFVGSDFALGRGREGDVPRLKQLGEVHGYSVNVVPPFKIDEQVVSSSLIRAALAHGDVDRATLFLGRPYSLSGEVVPGDGRGRTIGIPTANLSVWAERALPEAGVYVCRARTGGRSWGAVTNVGVRPTFETQPVSPRVEAHLFDFEGDLYSENLQLDFLAWIRAEQRFPTVQALVEQINLDITHGKEMFRSLDAGYPGG